MNPEHMNPCLRVAVIGSGFFGRYHAQHYSSLPGVELTAVVDRNEAAARALADELGCAFFSDHRELYGSIDAASVVTPTASHFGLAADLLEQGISVLVEKPITSTVDEARSLIRLARRTGCVLQVGHVERFNPTWLAFESRPFTPSFIETRRMSPFPFRSLDVSVVLDVMIHDIDLVLAAAGSTVVDITSSGFRQVSNTPDSAWVSITFASGCQAHLSASRVHHRSERTMRLWSDSTGLDLDFLNRTSTRYQPREYHAQSVLPMPTNGEERTRLLEMMFETVSCQHDKSAQPLRLELEEFVRNVRTGRTPKVSGDSGLDALVVAQMIEQRIESQRRRHAA